MTLISSNISSTSIFLQGSPGSGKSCAARNYGANRCFNNRDPILSVNCHRDLKFEYLVGSYIFKNSKFYFIDGPLLTAIKNGEPILLDEFNLCPENVLINLLPILKANINEKIYLKGIPNPIYISPGFLLIATGNSSKEKGRNALNYLINDELKIIQINNIDLKSNNYIIKNILEKEFPEICQHDDLYDAYKISTIQIQQIDEALREIVQFNLSLRQIKCLLERITRFCLEENYDTCGLKRIPVIYVIISYIIPQLIIGPEKLEELLSKLVSIMKYKNDEGNETKEITEFISSKVEFESINIKKGETPEEKGFIKKGKIYLETGMKENFLPQVALQTYFWIRMSCSIKSELPSDENILLAGTTSYKDFLLNEWLTLTLKFEKKNILILIF